MTDHQPETFDIVTQQGDLFAADGTENLGIMHPDPDIIRERLGHMLDAVKASRNGSPWDSRETKMNLILFPQMAQALPPDEANSLQLAFEFELTGLGIAA